MQAIIIIETVTHGSGTVSLSQMVTPLGTSSVGSEDEVIASLDADYEVRAICDLVDDADTQNPWDLPDNAGLEAEITGAINYLISENSVAENQYWQLSTDLQNIDW